MASRSGVDQRWDTLGDLLADIDSVPEELTIYVPRGEQVALTTRVMLVDEQDESPPASSRYLLEISIAKEVLDVWSAWRGGRSPRLAEACEAVVYYASHDAYLPIE